MHTSHVLATMKFVAWFPEHVSITVPQDANQEMLYGCLVRALLKDLATHNSTGNVCYPL